MRSGIRAIRLKGLFLHPSGAKYHRARREGRQVYTRLPDLPIDHPDFLAAFAAAARGQEAPPAWAPETIGSTWRAALASDLLHSYSEGYRAMIRRHAQQLCARAGHVKAAAVAERHIRADLRDTTSPGDRLKAWRFWTRFCLERGWLETDPSAPIRLRLRAGEGHPMWTREEIEAFRAAWPIGTTARAIMELGFWTGARIGDLCLIGPQHIGRDGVLSFRQSKTGGEAFVPWHATLPSWAADMDRDRALCHAAIARPTPALTFLQTAAGRTRSHKAAGHLLAAACRQIGLERSAHGLRKARASVLAESGATPAQIGAWTGHQSLSEITHYTRQMDRRASVRGTRAEQTTVTLDAQTVTRADKAL